MAAEPAPGTHAPAVIHDMDADAWRRKIEALSRPVTTQGVMSRRAVNKNRDNQLGLAEPARARGNYSAQQLYGVGAGYSSQQAAAYERRQAGGLGGQRAAAASYGNYRAPAAASSYGSGAARAAAPAPAPARSRGGAGNDLCMVCFDTNCKCLPRLASAGKPQLCTKCFDIPCVCR